MGVHGCCRPRWRPGSAVAAFALSLLFPAVGIWFLVAFAFSGVVTDLVRRVIGRTRHRSIR